MTSSRARPTVLDEITERDRVISLLKKNKIELLPCGLPIINGNWLYSTKEIDRVMGTCGMLVMYKICTKKMGGACFMQKLKRHEVIE